MEKIEFIEVNGNQVPLSVFPDAIKQQVSTFEIVRKQYNESAVLTQALGDYMQRLSGAIQAMAQEHINALTAPKVSDAVTPGVAADTSNSPAEE